MMRTGIRKAKFLLSTLNPKSRDVNVYLPVLVKAGSVVICAENSIVELKCCVISERSSDDCLIDIAVAPTIIAITTTNNLDFLKHSGIRINAPIQTRQLETALCNNAPDHSAAPRASAR